MYSDPELYRYSATAALGSIAFGMTRLFLSSISSSIAAEDIAAFVFLISELPIKIRIVGHSSWILVRQVRL